MQRLKKIIQAGTIAVLTAQTACSSLPATVPEELQPVQGRQPKDLVYLVKEHWMKDYGKNNFAMFKQNFDASKRTCSAEKGKLTLAMECYVPFKYPLRNGDGLYFNVDRSNYAEWNRDIHYAEWNSSRQSRTSVVENGTETFRHIEVYYPHIAMREVDVLVPGLCLKLMATANFRAESCSDQVSVSVIDENFSFTPVTSTNNLEILAQAGRLQGLLGAAENAKADLGAEFGAKDWFDEQLEKARQERRDALKPLVKKFGVTVKASKSYHSLIDDKQFELLFEEYNFLSNPSMGVARLRSSEEDPDRLNYALQRIFLASSELPWFDQAALQNSQVYLAASLEETQKKCLNKGAGACYDVGTKTIILPIDTAELPATLSHELAHRHMYHLSPGEQLRIKRKLQPLVMKREVQKDVIRSKETNLVDSWQDGSKDPRFNCPKPYAATSLDEYIAVYKEDLVSNNGNGILSLLQPGNETYHKDVITTLETLAEAVFFSDNPRDLLDNLYQKAGIRPSEFK